MGKPLPYAVDSGIKQWCDRHGFTCGKSIGKDIRAREFRVKGEPPLEIHRPRSDGVGLVFIHPGMSYSYISESEAILWLLANGFERKRK